MLRSCCAIWYFRKDRRAVFNPEVDRVLHEVYLGIGERYQMKFLEIGVARGHVHLLAQAVPAYRVTQLVTIMKSVTAREVFRRCLQVKR